VCLTVKPVGEPDAGNPHARFDERGWETERRRVAQATAPVLDSTEAAEGRWAEDIDKKGNTGDILRLSSLKR
jgi:hypothetical protein